MFRSETRKERYSKKISNAQQWPVSLCAINFGCDENLGHLIRACACFGAKRLFVIGSLPSHENLRRYSGSMQDLVEIIIAPNPTEFIIYCRENDITNVNMELGKDSYTLEETLGYLYDMEYENEGPFNEICIVVGNENTGIPVEILNFENSFNTYIPMDGPGHCLNTAMTANIALAQFIEYFKDNFYVSRPYKLPIKSS